MNDNIGNKYENRFDLVTCFHVFEHVFKPKNFIKIIQQILNTDGYYCIEVPNQNNELVNLSENYVNKVWYMNCHISYYTPQIFLSLVNNNNTKLIEFKGFERYGLFNFLYWIYYNKPQQGKVDYYNGISTHKIEELWIKNRNNDMTSDSMYAIIKI